MGITLNVPFGGGTSWKFKKLLNLNDLGCSEPIFIFKRNYMKKKTIVYLSGPITGVDNYEKKFEDEEKIVKEYFGKNVKLKIINPVKLGKKTERKYKKVIGRPSWTDYMKDCVQELPKANWVWMLPDWQKSKGARIEEQLAFDLGIRIIEICEEARKDYERDIIQKRGSRIIKGFYETIRTANC